MSTQKLTNISIAEFRKFLEAVGCTLAGTNGGHEKWTKEGLTRPIIIQTHIDPIPVFVVQNNLRNLGMTSKQYFETIANL